MLSAVETGHRKSSGHAHAKWKPAASYLTIPKLKIPRQLVTCDGPKDEIAELVSGLSERVDLSDVLARHHIANVVMVESVRKWLGQFMVPEIDHHLEADITLYPLKRNLKYSQYHEDDDDIFPKEDWILCFELTNIDYHTFVITKEIEKYEALHPGLGQFLLSAIDRTPFDLATPSFMLYFIRSAFWGGMKNEREFARDYLGIEDDDDEEMDDIINSMPVTYRDLTGNFPKWALRPKKRYKGIVPPEIAKIVEIADRNYSFKHSIGPYINLPGVLVWDDAGDYWEKTFVQADTDAMESSNESKFGCRYWTLSLKNKQELQENFAEIENFISGFYQLLQAIYKIKQMVSK